MKLHGIAGTREHLVRVFERSDRGSLDRFLLDQENGHSDLFDELVRSILLQIADTMARIHRRDITHRDLKAENILLFDDVDLEGHRTVRAKIADFDRAAPLAASKHLKEPVGSLFHMAPEQLSAERYGRKVDVFAFGILMFEVAHGGARPYSNVATFAPGSITKNEFARKVVEEGYRPNWEYGNEVLKALAARCWATDPNDRPDFEEIVEIIKSSQPLCKVRQLPQQPDLSNSDKDDCRFGLASNVGNVRTAMEDAVCVLSADDILVAGVFDGMNGRAASEISARQLPLILMDELRKQPDKPVAAVIDAFNLLDSSLREFEPPLESGSTALIALVRKNDFVLSWLGDSLAYLFRRSDGDAGFASLPLVDRHHPAREDEAARVIANGGVVGREHRTMDSGEAIPWGPLRVFVPGSGRKNGIALSRAVGLFAFKPAIGGDPEIVHLDRSEDDLFLVLGSDGVFDVLAPDKVYGIVEAATSAKDAADSIIRAVLKLGAPDNASVVVINMRDAGFIH